MTTIEKSATALLSINPVEEEQGEANQPNPAKRGKVSADEVVQELRHK